MIILAYKENDHARNLLLMLQYNKGMIKHMCPYIKYQLPLMNELKRISYKDVCGVCKRFVGIPVYVSTCPCEYFNPKEAVKRTWLALEEKGYLK